jgi:flagellar biogenesis protein FliO
MLDFVETILIKIFSLLPDANPENNVIASVNSAFNNAQTTFHKINLIFPVSTLFKVLMIVLFIELTLLLMKLILKAGVLFRG